MSTALRLALGLALAALLALAGAMLTKIIYTKLRHSLYVPPSSAVGGRGALGPSSPLLNRSVIPEAESKVSLRELLSATPVRKVVFKLVLERSTCNIGDRAYMYVKTYVYDYIEKKGLDYVLETAQHRYDTYSGFIEVALRERPSKLTCRVVYLINMTSLEGVSLLPGVELALPHITYLYSIQIERHKGTVTLKFCRDTDVLLADGDLVTYRASSQVIPPAVIREILSDVTLSEERRLDRHVPGIYLEVPDGLRPYLQQVASQILERCGYGSLQCVVKSLWSWIKSRYIYSRRIDVPRDVDPLVYVLTRGREANCLVANLVALLVLRVLGVPSRLAVGYVAPVVGREAVVTADLGHAWTEILVPCPTTQVGDIAVRYGELCGVWIPLDFTPPGAFGVSSPLAATSVSGHSGASGGGGGAGGGGGGGSQMGGASSGSGAEGESTGTSGSGGESKGAPSPYVYVLRGHCNVSRITLPPGYWTVLEVKGGRYSEAEVLGQGWGWIKLRVCACSYAPPVNDTVNIVLRSVLNNTLVKLPVLVIIRARTRTYIDRIYPSPYLAPGYKLSIAGRVLTDRERPVTHGKVHVYIAVSKSARPVVSCEGEVKHGSFNVTCTLPTWIQPGRYVVYAVYGGTSNYLSSRSDPTIFVTRRLDFQPQCTSCIAVHKLVNIKIRSPYLDVIGYLLSSGQARLLARGFCSAHLSGDHLEVSMYGLSPCRVTFLYGGSPEYAYTRVTIVMYPVQAKICIDNKCLYVWNSSSEKLNLTRRSYKVTYVVRGCSDLYRLGQPMLCLYATHGKQPALCLNLTWSKGETMLNLTKLRPGEYIARICVGDLRSIDPVFKIGLYRVALFRDVHVVTRGGRVYIRGTIVDRTGEPLEGEVCVKEYGTCYPVVDGKFNLSLTHVRSSLLTLVFHSRDPYTLSRPYVLHLSRASPVPAILILVLAVATVSGLLLYRKLAASRTSETRAARASRHMSHGYHARIVLPDIEPDMPPLWGLDAPLRVLIQVSTRDGSEVPCERIKLVVDGVYVGTGCMHLVKFPREGEYRMRVLVNNTVVAEQKVRIVDYRAECERLYNLTVLEHARRSGIDPESLTPRQILERLRDKFAREYLETVTRIFEIARYSPHDIKREHLVEMVRALRRLGFKVY